MFTDYVGRYCITSANVSLTFLKVVDEIRALGTEDFQFSNGGFKRKKKRDVINSDKAGNRVVPLLSLIFRRFCSLSAD